MSNASTRRQLADQIDELERKAREVGKAYAGYLIHGDDNWAAVLAVRLYELRRAATEAQSTLREVREQ